MVRRALGIAVMALLLGSCASADLGRGDVADVVEGAFEAAGQEVTDIDAASEPVEGRWPVSATLEDRSVELEVAVGSGRVLSVDFGDDTPILDQAELEAIAAHDANPAADRARRRQVLTLVVLLVGALAGGLLIARQLRLREEAGAFAR